MEMPSNMCFEMKSKKSFRGSFYLTKIFDKFCHIFPLATW